MNDNKDYQPADFVYAGRRRGSSGKMFVAVCRLQDSKIVGEEQWFGHRKNLERTIGCIYTGAQFSEGGARGLAEAKWSGKRLDDQEALIGWEARDKDAATADRAERMEKDIGRVSEMERVLLPLRRSYDAYRRQGDWEGMGALERTVFQVLRRSPRAKE